MTNETMINPSLQLMNQTVINSEIIQEYNRQNNIEDDEIFLRDGQVICDKYTIERRLEVSSGEANLYLCKHQNNLFVAKVYNRKFAIKQEVIDALLKIDSPFVAKLYETGSYKGYPVEILPYFKNGSLQGKIFTEEVLLRTIIPNINEGLRAIHGVKIIHKDLKPSNIMLSDDGETVSIIDFGISSAVKDNNTILITKTGMTPEYSAPETFKNIFYEGSDYYSFGVTLFELFCGYTPYANMQSDEIEQYVSVQRIPFPENFPINLQNFISALTYSDITNRNNKSNPNRRWTYEETKRWLKGDNLIIPGEGIGNSGKGTMPAYHFLEESYTDINELVAAFAKNWEDGKKQLFRGYIKTYFDKVNKDIALKCQAAEDEASCENGKDDIIFWRLLYQISPKLKGFYWKGKTYESLPAFGREVLSKLWSNDDNDFSYYSSILSNKLLTQYVHLAPIKNEKVRKAAAAIEDSYQLEVNNNTDMLRTYYLMAYALSGQKLFLLNGEQLRTVGELAEYMRNVLSESYERFESLCHRLVDYDGNLDFQLETWLIALGKQDELDRWRDSINN